MPGRYDNRLLRWLKGPRQVVSNHGVEAHSNVALLQLPAKGQLQSSLALILQLDRTVLEIGVGISQPLKRGV